MLLYITSKLLTYNNFISIRYRFIIYLKKNKNEYILDVLVVGLYNICMCDVFSGIFSTFCKFYLYTFPIAWMIARLMIIYLNLQ